MTEKLNENNCDTLYKKNRNKEKALKSIADSWGFIARSDTNVRPKRIIFDESVDNGNL